MNLHIREATRSDLDNVLSVHRAAFGHYTESELVRDLLEDPSSQPSLSLLALDGNLAVGHVLFSTVRLEDSGNTVPCVLLAPLAVVPAAQKQGIGSTLIERGLEILTCAGVGLVFVLGYPEYYLRYGFKPAGSLGFEATYPMPEQHADAWMVQELRPGVIGSVRGKVICADTLNRPEYWRE